jgi:hypothetical protein
MHSEGLEADACRLHESPRARWHGGCCLLHDRTKEVEAMLQPRDELHRITEALTRQRDQLRVKLHLARADARDEWGRMEKKWEHLKGRLSAIQETAGEVSEDIGHTLKRLVSEIEEGYERIRKLL